MIKTERIKNRRGLTIEKGKLISINQQERRKLKTLPKLRKRRWLSSKIHSRRNSRNGRRS